MAVKGLRGLVNFKSLERQVARWLEVLGTFDFEVEHRAEKKHSNADALSRQLCRQCSNWTDEREVESSDEVMEYVKELVKSINITQAIEQKCNCAKSINAKHQADGEMWIQMWPKLHIRNQKLADRNISKILNCLEKGSERPQWESASAESLALKALWSRWENLEVRDGILYFLRETRLGKESCVSLM